MFGKLMYDFVQALSKFDLDTKMLLLRVLIRAGQSGSANLYLKERLQRILDEDDRPLVSSSPRQVHVTSREVKR